MLSGVGPADDLDALGIPVIADRPGVGRNLRDHPKNWVEWRLADGVRIARRAAARSPDVGPLHRDRVRPTGAT